MSARGTSLSRPETRYARSGDVHIACANPLTITRSSSPAPNTWYYEAVES